MLWRLRLCVRLVFDLHKLLLLIGIHNLWLDLIILLPGLILVKVRILCDSIERSHGAAGLDHHLVGALLVLGDPPGPVHFLSVLIR